jgi:hypothetical protein
MTKLALWRYKPVTGYWAFVRDVTEDTAQQWLAIWQADEPEIEFKISKRKPVS